MKPKIFTSLILLALLIAACGAEPTPAEPTPDVAAVRTSAASTVVAQFTLTAAVFTPTLPALPTDTPAPENTVTQAPADAATSSSGTDQPLCDLLGFDPITVDVTIPDNTVMTPGQAFTKTWRIKNAGICPWGAGYVLTYAGYEYQMSGQFTPFTEVIQPGQEVDVSVQFKAPDQAGVYTSAWSMRNPAGRTFPAVIFVKILVQ